MDGVGGRIDVRVVHAGEARNAHAVRRSQHPGLVWGVCSGWKAERDVERLTEQEHVLAQRTAGLCELLNHRRRKGVLALHDVAFDGCYRKHDTLS